MKKIMIVIEETEQNGGKGFNVYLDGDTKRIGKIPSDQLSRAEFWGGSLFNICIHALREAGVIKTEQPKENKETIQ